MLGSISERRLCLPAERVEGPKDVRTFKRLLSAYHHNIYQQCQRAARAFARVVKTMAAKGEMYTSSTATKEKIEALWVTCGYEAIKITVEKVLWQV